MRSTPRQWENFSPALGRISPRQSGVFLPGTGEDWAALPSFGLNQSPQGPQPLDTSIQCAQLTLLTITGLFLFVPIDNGPVFCSDIKKYDNIKAYALSMSIGKPHTQEILDKRVKFVKEVCI